MDKESRKAYRKAYYEQNREQFAVYAKAYYEQNREQFAVYAKAYYEQNRERITARNKAWSEKNREKIRQAAARRRKANPEKGRASTANYRHRRRANGGTVTLAEWKAKLAEYEGCCAYCGEPATDRDHVIPITRGGQHVIENLVPACGTCNRSKANKLLSEWRPL